MADYDPTETLTRMLAFDRLKHLSRAYLDAKEHGDGPAMRLINEERDNIKRQFIKVVK